jgi:O-antigen/teichoic acid export membrane protein
MTIAKQFGKPFRILTAWQKVRGVSPFGANAALTAGTNVLMGLLGLLSGSLAARLLGPVGRGELVAIQTWPSIVGSIAVVGLPEAIVYYSARKPEESGTFLASGISLAVLFAAPCALVAYALMPWLLHAQRPAVAWAARWYLLVILPFAAGIMMEPLRARDDFLTWNVLRLCPVVLWVAVLVLGWRLERATPVFLAAAQLSGMFIVSIAIAWVLFSRIPGPFTPEPNRWPAMLRYGLPCVLTTLPQTLNLRLDQMLMAAFLPAPQLGLYAVAVAWSAAAAPLHNAVGSALLPSVASAKKEGLHEFVTGVRIALTLAMVLSVALVTVTPRAIILLFGRRFLASVPVAILLVPAGCLLGLNFVLQEGLRGLGHPQAGLQAESVGLVVTAIGLATMLRPFGIMGAAVSSILGYCTVTVVLLYNTWRLRRVSPSVLLPGRRELLAPLRRFRALLHALGVSPND